MLRDFGVVTVVEPRRVAAGRDARAARGARVGGAASGRSRPMRARLRRGRARAGRRGAAAAAPRRGRRFARYVPRASERATAIRLFAAATSASRRPRGARRGAPVLDRGRRALPRRLIVFAGHQRAVERRTRARRPPGRATSCPSSPLPRRPGRSTATRTSIPKKACKVHGAGRDPDLRLLRPAAGAGGLVQQVRRTLRAAARHASSASGGASPRWRSSASTSATRRTRRARRSTSTAGGSRWRSTATAPSALLYRVGVGPTTFFAYPGGVLASKALGELRRAS